MNTLLQHKRFPLVITVALISLILFLWFINANLFKSRADEEKVNILFSEQTGSVPLNQDKTVDIIVQPVTSGSRIAGFSGILTTEGVLQIVRVDDPTSYPENQVVFEKILENVGAQRRVYVLNEASEQSPPVAIRVQVVVRATTAGSGKLKVNTASTQIVGTGSGYQYGYNTVQEANFTFGESVSGTPVVSPSGSLSATPRTTITSSITPSSTPRPTGVTTTPIVSITPRVSITGSVTPGVTTRPVTPGISLTPGISATVFPSPVVRITASPTGFPIPSILVTQIISQPPIPTSPPPDGDISVIIRLKFQGVQQANNANMRIPVKITVAGGVLPRPISKTIDFQPDTGFRNGVWVGTLDMSVNAPPAGGAYPSYKMFIKGPKHLQKRICWNYPEETFPGTYRCGDEAFIYLDQEFNEVDLTRIIQLVGDLDQDGVVTSADISRIANNLGSTDPAVVAKADVNFDGVVNALDYSLLIASLSVKYDE